MEWEWGAWERYRQVVENGNSGDRWKRMRGIVLDAHQRTYRGIPLSPSHCKTRLFEVFKCLPGERRKGPSLGKMLGTSNVMFHWRDLEGEYRGLNELIVTRGLVISLHDTIYRTRGSVYTHWCLGRCPLRKSNFTFFCMHGASERSTSRQELVPCAKINQICGVKFSHLGCSFREKRFWTSAAEHPRLKITYNFLRMRLSSRENRFKDGPIFSQMREYWMDL